MQHPELEAKLQELKEQRQKTLEAFRNLASEAITSADRSNKTMMMFIPTEESASCVCTKEHPCEQHVSKERRTLRLKKRKKA